MGGRSSRRKTKKRGGDTTSSASSSSSFSTNSDDDHRVEASSKRYKGRHRRCRGEGGYRREREETRTKKKRKERERKRKRHRRSSRRSRREQKRKVSDSDSSSGESESASGYDSEPQLPRQQIVQGILKEFPGVSADLEQLLRMIDGGQAVDISGLSERSLVKHLKKLFQSLNLKESGNHVFLLPTNVSPTLDIVMPIIQSQTQSEGYSADTSKVLQDAPSIPPDVGCNDKVDDDVAVSCPREDIAGPKRRVIGPEMPSAELLAAAAKLTEAEAELREVQLEESELFIGPPPPAMVTEAESANEAERFEEVTGIMGVEVDSPYDVLGVNKDMSADKIKKRYWKLSLMVHPDKCSHPQAHQAFIKLNKAFKDLQDPNKRKALDEQINLKEEQEKFKVELKAMREAAQWRHSQGLYMDGDDVLLSDMGTEVAPKRDEWMTTLPPERKPGMTMHTTRFSRNPKEGRGDTSVWTDTPAERAQKAKTNYLEAYNEATTVASKELAKRSIDSVAQLVDDYNEAKRSKSLVEKNKEAAAAAARSGSKKKSKRKQEQAKEEWEGQHPWKPWDREKDLTAGQKTVNFDGENLAQGLSSRFSSGSFQRNFL